MSHPSTRQSQSFHQTFSVRALLGLAQWIALITGKGLGNYLAVNACQKMAKT